MKGTAVNNISATIQIDGRVDNVLIQKSIRLVLKSDASLRSRIVLDEAGIPMQYHEEYEEEDFPMYDLSRTSPAEIHGWELAVTRETIPVLDGPLYRFLPFRTGENSGGVLVKIHHIISDGWSQYLVCNRILNTYLKLLEGEDAELEESPDYELHVLEEQKYLQSKAYEKDKKYWENIAKIAEKPAMLKSITSAALSHVGNRVTFELPHTLNHAIYAFCQEHRIAPFAVFYMALAIYFQRISGAEYFTIGVPIMNRTNYTFKQTTGMFVTTLPFTCRVDDTWTWTEFGSEFANTWFDLLRHQRFPYSHIEKLYHNQGGHEGNLFNIAFSYQSSQIAESRDASVRLLGYWHYNGYQSEQLCIHLTNMYDNKQYSVDYDYLSQCFSEEEIVRLHKTLCSILQETLRSPDKPLKKLAVLTEEERERVVYSYNRSSRFIGSGTVFQTLSENACKYPKRVAAIFRGERFTYEQLMDRARVIACRINACVDSESDLVAVLLPRSFELLAVIAGILGSGRGYLLLSPGLPVERIRRILIQSKAGLLVTASDVYVQSGLKSEKPARYFIDEKQPGTVFFAEKEELTGGRQEQLAYVVYTSGSTGTPKGVEISQRNLLNFALGMEKIYAKGAVLSICNVGFDAFVIESAAALLNGRTIVIADQEEQESPRKLAALIRGYAVGFMAMTPSRLSAFMKEPAFCEALRNMESILCGGEGFPANLLKDLKNRTSARIYNQYGPSETTVGVSVKELSHARTITAGKPMENCRMYVLDQWMNPLPEGVYGNLYVGGECVGIGYRGSREMTEERFLNNPFESGGRMYNTGDEACWTGQGEIVLAGRKDGQVKLRGQRIELQEVAACIASHPQVEEAAVRICEWQGQQVLTAYYCGKKEIAERELLSFAAIYLPVYMLPSFVIRVNNIPMTANGKVDETRLPTLASVIKEETGEGTVSQMEEDLLSIFRKVLEQPQMGVTQDYFLSGGNSLNAMQTLAQVEDLTGKKLKVADLYTCRSARKLVAYLSGETADVSAPESEGKRIQPAPLQASYPLSAMQQGILIQSHLDPSGVAYNMPGAFLLPEDTDLERLERALRQLLEEDAIFRTSFVQEEGGIRAHVAPEVPFVLESCSGESLKEVARSFVRPFDLEKAPLLRAGLWRRTDGRKVLLLDSHHIVGDGVSTSILLKRLNLAYGGKHRESSLSYHDYVWYLQQGQREKEQEKHYWKEQLKDLPEVLVLPADFSRTASFDFKGAQCAMAFSGEFSHACDAFCREKKITAFVLFAAAYGILLSRVSGKEDFILGTPSAGRMYSETQDICGPFINTLPLRFHTEGDKTVSCYLEELSRTTVGLLDHQNVSLEEMISMLHLTRGAKNPIYQMMFSQSPVDAGTFLLGDRTLEYLPLPVETVKMDLTAELSREAEQYCIRFTYAVSLFQEETIRFYGRCMEQILREMMGRPFEKLERLKVLCEEDYERYVEKPYYTNVPFVNMPIHWFVERKAKTAPDNAAIIYHGNTVTRRQLERRACALAGSLKTAQVPRGTCVGLAFARTPDMIAAMLAILKAGCAYMPMLPSFPKERLSYMLKTAGAQYILCDPETASVLPQSLGSRILLAQEGEADSFENVAVSDEDLVNVMFTSGSTGKPKGVMLRHRAVSSLFVTVKELLGRVGGPILCTTNVVFDSFIGESLFPLAMGKSIVLTDEEEMMLPWKLAGIIEQTKAEIFQVTPARLQMCLGNDAFRRAAAGLKLVLLGGEVLTQQLLHKLREVTDAGIVNMYGPTEATVYMTLTDVEDGDHITVGHPIYNGRIYVLDEKMRPVIPTGCGELYMAGECLAKGYISQKELTEKAFLPDVYFPGEKMYKSGDIGRMRLDGTFDFIGRKDAQVKLNGQRVELDEITGAMLELCEISQAATVALRKEDESMELCAFYVTKELMSGEQLRAELKKKLPVYMIPSHFFELETIPLSASSKADVQALKKIAAAKMAHVAGDVSDPALEPVQKELAAPMPEPEQKPTKIPLKTVPENGISYVLNVWKKVLSGRELNEKETFFEQGGTSLAALSVLSLYFNDGKEMSLEEFYEYPTAGEQARMLGFVPVEEEMPKKPLSQKTTGSKKAVFVTGATGFLGVHLIKYLLENEKGKIYCLMRDGGKKRLRDTLIWYFGSGVVIRGKDRLRVVQGDIGKEKLGLTEAKYQKLQNKVGEIYHCAADVRHYAANQSAFLNNNVDGTVHMLQFARDAGARFYHMSTCSVSGEHFKEKDRAYVYTEQDFDIGQIWESNIYVKSKFLAEEKVFEAIRDGVDARIFRIGRLVGRTTDGVFQKNPDTNAFYLLMRAFHIVGAVPEMIAGNRIDLTPVDYAAKAVLALKDSQGTVFHIISPQPPTVGDLVKRVFPGMKVLPDEQFSEKLAEEAVGRYREYVSVLIDYWYQIKKAPPVIEVSGEETVQKLKECGFAFDIPSEETLLASFPMQDSWMSKEEE